MKALKEWSLRNCTLVLVTNKVNGHYAYRTFGIHTVALPDPLPTYVAGDHPSPPPTSSPDVLLICSFAEDEPVELLLNVCRALAPDHSIAITGDANRLSASARQNLSATAQLTGFQPEEVFWGLLRRAGCCLVLSTEAACIPCGAYESIAVGKRPIVADDPANRRVFGDLATYVELTPESIVRAVRHGIRDLRETADPRLPERYSVRSERWWNEVLRVLPVSPQSPESASRSMAARAWQSAPVEQRNVPGQLPGRHS